MASRETEASVRNNLKQLSRLENRFDHAKGFVRSFQTTPDWLLAMRRMVQVLRAMLARAEAMLAAVEANVAPDDQFGQHVKQLELPFDELDDGDYKSV
jgi:hypothetical protein